MFFATPIRPNVCAPGLRSIDRNLERLLSQGLTHSHAVRVEQDDKAYTLQIDLPGLSKAHLVLEIEDSVVRIASKDGAPRQVKLAYEVSQEIDAANSKAALEDGVLTLTLAKFTPVSRVTPLDIA